MARTIDKAGHAAIARRKVANARRRLEHGYCPTCSGAAATSVTAVTSEDGAVLVFEHRACGGRWLPDGHRARIRS
jgi:hypothetical protein